MKNIEGLKEKLEKRLYKDAFDRDLVHETKEDLFRMIDDMVDDDIPRIQEDASKVLELIESNEELDNVFKVVGYLKDIRGKNNNTKWIYQTSKNMNAFIEAYLTGKWIVFKDNYYAKIKAWEIVDQDALSSYEFDKENGEQGLGEDGSWYRNVYFVLQMNENIVIDMKDSGLRGAKEFMTKEEWRELGVTEDNAVFEKVKGWSV